MSARVIVLGTGKMGSEIAAHLLGRGCALTWATRSPSRLADLERRAGRLRRRAARARGVAAGEVELVCALVSDCGDVAAEVIVEAVDESLVAKRAVLAGLRLGPDSALLSTSSSLLPADIHPRCTGMHFFHPVMLTAFVEIVGGADVAGAVTLAEAWGLAHVVQDRRSAFAANRLLLPLQAEAHRLVAAGTPPGVVNASTISPLLPLGQLELIERVGRAVIAASVESYAARMEESEARELRPLRDALATGGQTELTGEPDPALAERLRSLFVNTCHRFLEEGLLERASLDAILSHALLAESTLDDVVGAHGPAAIAQELRRAHAETGLSYFEPSPMLTDPWC